MKVLIIDACFLLPDEFDGTEADAIHLLAEHHQEHQATGDYVIVAKLETPKKQWEDFLACVKKNKRLHMGIFCGEHKNNKWLSYEDKK